MLSLLVAGFILLVARGAEAFPSSRLVYTRGAGAEHCPEESALRRAVAARLGYDPFFPSAERTIVASIVRASAKLKGQAQLVDDHGIVRGTREYFAEPDRCDELVGALALSISISIDPTRATAAPVSTSGAAAAEVVKVPDPPRERSPAVVAEASVSVAPPVEPRDGASRVRPRELSRDGAIRWGAGALTRLFVGTAPTATFAPAVSLSARVGVFSLDVQGGGEVPTVNDFRVGTNVIPIRQSRLFAAVAPCFHYRAFFFCGVASLGRHAAYRDDGTERGDARVVLAAGARVGTEVAIADFLGLRLDVEGLAPLVRPSVTSGGLTLWQTPLASTALTSGLVLHFP